LRRPGIQKALAMLAAHDADAIVTAKLDRLTRSVKDFMGLLETSARQRWDIVVLDFQLDTTTASGRMSAGMMMQFAQFERELIGERTKAALAAAKSRGVVLGARPSIDPEVQALISELRDAGLGARRIAARLNEDGVPTVRGGRWQPSTVARVFVRLDTPDGLAPYMGVRFDKDKEAE
jgi:DNA invertase Pin-like site-specific DNA recombinase